jgi:hypothetical protein
MNFRHTYRHHGNLIVYCILYETIRGAVLHVNGVGRRQATRGMTMAIASGQEMEEYNNDIAMYIDAMEKIALEAYGRDFLIWN